MRERLTKLTIDEVLPYIEEGPKYTNRKRHTFAGESVKMSSLRLHTFKRDECTCKECGLQASFFALERTNPDAPYNLELYSVTDETEILFTKDHITPKSLGGKDYIDNMQCMCVDCNLAKGNTKAGEPNINTKELKNDTV